MAGWLAKIRAWLYASQEFTVWLPAMVLLTAIGFIVLGAFVRLHGDALAWLAELPAHCAYVGAWLGSAWLIKAVYMHDLPADVEKELHAAAELGNRSAQWVLIKDRIETFAALIITGSFWLLVGGV